MGLPCGDASQPRRVYLARDEPTRDVSWGVVGTSVAGISARFFCSIWKRLRRVNFNCKKKRADVMPCRIIESHQS